MSTLDKIDKFLEERNAVQVNEGILSDLKGAFKYYVNGISAMDDVSKEVKRLAAQATKEGEGKSDEEKRMIVDKFMKDAKTVVLRSKMHASMKAGYIEGIEKSFGKKIGA